MDFQRLQRFVVLAQECNYTRAAEKLNIPQPHLSKQIKQLEDELKVNLFDRTTRPLQLTYAGTVFLQEVKRILAQLQQAQRLAQRAASGEIGQLSIGINTSVSNSLLPDFLQAFRAQFPEVKLVLQELLAKESHEKLIAGVLDVNFENFQNLSQIDAQYPLTYEIIHKESFVVVLPQQHPLTQKSVITIQDLENEPFVMPASTSVPGLYKIIETLFQDSKISPNICQEATWMTTILSLVAGGMGISLLPENVRNLQRSGVVYRDLMNSSDLFQLAMIWKKENRSQVLTNFLKMVRDLSLTVDLIF